MALNLIIRHDGDGQTQIFLRHSGANNDVPFGDARPFESPLTPDDLDDLRFYLEDYAQLPIGEYLTRGERVEKVQLASWGEALFAVAFGGDEKRREAFVTVRNAVNDGKPVEVVIESDDPRFLGLPWELMKAPDDKAPLSTRVACFDRSRPIQAPARQFADAAQGFRVLMVIARPQGMSDAPFQAVARPLFEHLEKHDGPVKIDVLRPPTFAEFRRRLEAAKGQGSPYHAVHFDGHGAFGVLQAPNGAFNPNFFAAEAPQGFVLFEKEAGGEDFVGARDFAEAIRESGAPLVILNACQSAMVDAANGAAGPEASVATRLLQEGAASVVAMSYSVYVVAAAAFMAAFYEALFAGKCVSEAVNDGRKALRIERNSLRPSLKGEMKLQDWMAPVHYARSTLRLPVAPQRKAASPMDIVAQVLASAAARNGEASADPLAAAEKFFGRDAEFFVLEQAARGHRVALIHGVGGAGKTELAKAFARWLLISGGLDDPRLVFVHEFLPGRPTFGLDAILGDILAGLGSTELYLQAADTKARANLVLQILTQVRGLLVWDNFETAASMPEPGQATPPLDDEKKTELLWFIGEMRKTRSALFITSRSEEAWLGGPDALTRCEVGGLERRDALAYADHVLSPHAAAVRRREDDPAGFKLLLDYLQGHPLSLKLILPHLASQSAAALLEALKGLRDLPESQHGGRRKELASLTASIAYSFRHLPEEDRRRLIILSLFEKVVSANILGTLEEAHGQFADLDVDDWDALLDRLADLGVLSGRGGGLYLLHPALPPFLAARWREQAGEDFAVEREQTLNCVIGAAAQFVDYLQRLVNSGDAQSALRQIFTLRSNLGAFLGAALDRRRFAEAHAIIQALNEYWWVAGLTAEAQEWTDRVLAATEASSGGVPQIETNAHSLWLFVKIAEANRAHFARQLDKAEATYRQITASFEGRDTEKARRSLATSYHMLGMVAEERGQLDEAEGWHQKSLAINEALDNKPRMAASYHQLGTVALEHGQLDEAEGWHKKSLAINEALDNKPHMASNYHLLGSVAMEHGRLNEAERWYKKSLAINEALDNKPVMATTYNQLGIVTLERGQLNEAEGWHKKSLAIKEYLDDKPGMAVTLGNLSKLRASQGDGTAALRFAVHACAMFDEFPNRHSYAPQVLAVVWRELGREPVAAAWREVTGQDMPAAMPEALDALAAALPIVEAEGSAPVPHRNGWARGLWRRAVNKLTLWRKAQA